jgi:hypothetical protein
MRIALHFDDPSCSLLPLRTLGYLLGSVHDSSSSPRMQKRLKLMKARSAKRKPTRVMTQIDFMSLKEMRLRVASLSPADRRKEALIAAKLLATGAPLGTQWRLEFAQERRAELSLASRERLRKVLRALLLLRTKR